MGFWYLFAGALQGRLREGGTSCLFFFNWKNSLILEKANLIVFIYELNFSFRMLFYQYLAEKTPKCSLWGRCFMFCRRALIPRNLSCSENFLVLPLYLSIFLHKFYPNLLLIKLYRLPYVYVLTITKKNFTNELVFIQGKLLTISYLLIIFLFCYQNFLLGATSN